MKLLAILLIIIAGVYLIAAAPAPATMRGAFTAQAAALGGRQDLLLANTGRRPIHFVVVDAGPGQVAVQATAI